MRDNGDGRARLTLSGSGLRAFLIDYSTNLVDWQVFGQTPASADTTTFYDSYTGPRRFYRARRRDALMFSVAPSPNHRAGTEKIDHGRHGTKEFISVSSVVEDSVREERIFS